MSQIKRRQEIQARSYKIGGILLLTLPLLFAISCKSILPNQAPVIQSISGADYVDANSSIALTCVAGDPDGDQLGYFWTCTHGYLSSSVGSTVIWYAPEVSGNAIVSVTVSDGRGGSDTRSKTITVNRVTTTLINWDGQIPAGYYRYWTSYLKSGYTVSGNFWVDDYDINFLILDAANYENWRNNMSYNYVIRVLRSAETSFSATIPTEGTYYIILDNTFSLFTDKFAHLFLQKTSP